MLAEVAGYIDGSQGWPEVPTVVDEQSRAHDSCARDYVCICNVHNGPYAKLLNRANPIFLGDWGSKIYTMYFVWRVYYNVKFWTKNFDVCACYNFSFFVLWGCWCSLETRLSPWRELVVSASCFLSSFLL